MTDMMKTRNPTKIGKKVVVASVTLLADAGIFGYVIPDLVSSVSSPDVVTGIFLGIVTLSVSTMSFFFVVGEDLV
jgi:hypothetical protein